MPRSRLRATGSSRSGPAGTGAARWRRRLDGRRPDGWQPNPADATTSGHGFITRSPIAPGPFISSGSTAGTEGRACAARSRTAERRGRRTTMAHIECCWNAISVDRTDGPRPLPRQRPARYGARRRIGLRRRRPAVVDAPAPSAPSTGGSSGSARRRESRSIGWIDPRGLDRRDGAVVPPPFGNGRTGRPPRSATRRHYVDLAVGADRPSPSGVAGGLGDRADGAGDHAARS